MPSSGLNAALGTVGNLLAAVLDPYQVFNFFIEIEGIIAGSFSECSGLQVETEIFEYREGGLNEYVHHFAGPTKYPPLILKHGLTQIFGLWSWHQDVVHNRIQRKNGTIYLLDKMHIPVMWWNFREGLPVKWTGPDLNAESGNVAFESIEIVHRGLSRPTLANLAAV